MGKLIQILNVSGWDGKKVNKASNSRYIKATDIYEVRLNMNLNVVQIVRYQDMEHENSIGILSYAENETFLEHEFRRIVEEWKAGLDE